MPAMMEFTTFTLLQRQRWPPGSSTGPWHATDPLVRLVVQDASWRQPEYYDFL